MALQTQAANRLTDKAELLQRSKAALAAAGWAPRTLKYALELGEHVATP